jgi:hypothetical protein
MVGLGSAAGSVAGLVAPMLAVPVGRAVWVPIGSWLAGGLLIGGPLAGAAGGTVIWSTAGRTVAGRPGPRSCGHEVGNLRCPGYFSMTIIAAAFTKARKLAAFFS